MATWQARNFVEPSQALRKPRLVLRGHEPVFLGRLRASSATAVAVSRTLAPMLSKICVASTHPPNQLVQKLFMYLCYSHNVNLKNICVYCIINITQKELKSEI